MNENNNIVIYQLDDGKTKIDVKLKDETVWLSQQQMAELFNTSIEEVVNLLSPEIRIHAKYAKDIAAGAVLVNAFFAAVVGCIILIPKIISLF